MANFLNTSYFLTALDLIAVKYSKSWEVIKQQSFYETTQRDLVNIWGKGLLNVC